jgi:hypothetical protein
MSFVSRPMSTTDQFWQYAREALLSACEAETENDRDNLFDLAQTWTQAALTARHSPIDDDKTARAAYPRKEAQRYKCRYRLNVKKRLPFLRAQAVGAAMDQ